MKHNTGYNQLKHVFWVLMFLGILPGKLYAQKDLPETVKQFLHWEFNTNDFNDTDKRGKQSFDMQHVEIPYEAVKSLVASNVDSAVLDSLIFVKDGKSYVRWVINPEDTEYSKKLIKHLEKKKVPYKLGTFFKGYLTASRSMIALNPETGSVFSVKVSTNKTGGAWKDKGVDFVQANKALLATDIVHRAEKSVGYETVVPLHETIGLTIEGIDQSLIVRELGEMGKGKKYYLPGFAAINSAEGKRLAALNGSKDPQSFWKEHLAANLGTAMAEQAALTGLTYESAHPQQFLIELDERMKPTGKIVLRDFNDSYAMTPAFDQKNFPFHKKMMDDWISHYKKNDLFLRFGIFKGSGNRPKWVDKKQMKEWVETFFQAFEKRFAHLASIPLEKLESPKLLKASGTPTSYVTVRYLTGIGFFNKSHYEYWGHFLKSFPCIHGASESRDGRDCKEVLAELKMLMHGNQVKACKERNPRTQF